MFTAAPASKRIAGGLELHKAYRQVFGSIVGEVCSRLDHLVDRRSCVAVASSSSSSLSFFSLFGQPTVIIGGATSVNRAEVGPDLCSACWGCGRSVHGSSSFRARSLDCRVRSQAVALAELRDSRSSSARIVNDSGRPGPRFT